MDSTHFGPQPIMPTLPVFLYRKVQGDPRFADITMARVQAQVDALKGGWTPNLLSLMPPVVAIMPFTQIEDVLAAQPGPPPPAPAQAKPAAKAK